MYNTLDLPPEGNRDMIKSELYCYSTTLNKVKLYLSEGGVASKSVKSVPVHLTKGSGLCVCHRLRRGFCTCE